MGKLNIDTISLFPNMLYCSNSSCANPFNPDDNKFCIKCGQTLTPLFRNRFRVIRILGEGGFSKTYEARDADKIDEPCVIKQFVPQFEGTAALEKATELFKQEAKRLYDLGEHSQIPRLIAYFEQDKRLYLVQELIQGQNLLQELQQQGAFSEEKIKQLLTDLLPILKFIHERGVIHRDIKPENIMRRLDGKLILIDFGVSKQITKTFVGVGTTVGTPGYTPLEQMRGQVFPASDLYSLGVTCIRLLTQILPNADGSDELYDALRGCWIWRKYLPQSRSITPDFGKVLDKLIQDYVKERYQSSEEVIKTINAVNSASSKSIYGKHIKATISSKPNYPSSPHHLNTAVTASFARLNELLASGRWQDANEETFDIMLKIADREKQGSLYLEDIEKFSCEDLFAINYLWNKYSNGHFGFNVQKQIWQNMGGSKEPDWEAWCSFGSEVGWLRFKMERQKLLFFIDLFEEMSPVWFDDLIFSIKAPKGHLPCFKITGMTLVVSLILLRCEECGL
ncbi:serine/threonine-protein kinase [Nostoc sphaeroides]|uniref:serine/threonine-protein kinase n=1 Tax=Nostoc sphaeroides TaxID=446679 RepID=UPI001CED4FC3|nr:serine/threonine-protein kinase [Nostoc sphaeroides]